MGKHTKGPITVQECAEGYGVANDMDFVMTDFMCGAATTRTARLANAESLALCWNALSTLTNDEVAKLRELFAAVRAYRECYRDNSTGDASKAYGELIAAARAAGVIKE